MIVKTVEIFSDSRLVVGQVKGELETRDVRMQEYLSQVKRLQSDFDLFSLSSIWIKQIRLQRAQSICMKSKWVLAGWTP